MVLQLREAGMLLRDAPDTIAEQGVVVGVIQGEVAEVPEGHLPLQRIGAKKRITNRKKKRKEGKREGEGGVLGEGIVIVIAVDSNGSLVERCHVIEETWTENKMGEETILRVADK